MKHTSAYVAALSVMMSLSSASATAAQETHAYGDGWRKGRVVAILKGNEFVVSGSQDCRKTLSGDADQRFAHVTFFGRHSLTAMDVPLSANSDIAVGDRVYVKVGDCSAGLTRVATEK